MQEPEKKDIPADRDIPSVAMSPQGHRLFMGGFLCLALVAMIYVVMTDGRNTSDQPMVRHEDIAFKTSSKSSAPYIKSESSEKTSPAQLPTPVPDPLALQREQMMQTEALRMAQEQQKRLQKRLQSPQLVFDQSGSSPATNKGMTGATTATNADAALSVEGGNDANLAFAAQASGQGFDTSRAARMKNLNTLIAQGTLISGILETAIQSDLPGMTRAIVSDDIYSFDGSTLIIPKGSKLIGQYRSGLVRGQSRVFVIWNRLLRNDGVTVNLGSFGTDSLGRSGLGGNVDTHFFERFGSSVLLSMINTSLQIIASDSKDTTTSTVALETGDDFSSAAEIALENTIAIPPIINVEQGKRIKVFVSKDLDFSQVTAKDETAGPL